MHIIIIMVGRAAIKKTFGQCEYEVGRWNTIDSAHRIKTDTAHFLRAFVYHRRNVKKSNPHP